ncbi:D-tagatose-1 [Perilla frutescens var. hirtella]|uniref:D-tagatose-1 n=1 Tax=Perilla frutescens var. hirtella TaxID=608512 RepID=A0AAD4J259_PERFH|nr:D-tagatose-1 [Perilla frutescens var. hirtella]KAH6825360.1 D-tagatose-1 [Perilla frutescens var. hirtella]
MTDLKSIELLLAIQWVSEERVTLFTSDGLIQIGGNLVPRRVSSADKKQGNAKMSQRSQRFQESKYMDPNQSLCLGALFDIAATNGLDTGRRLCIFGFCRSVEMLCDVVEDTVLEHGGEVVAAEKASKGGLNEKLTMIVAVPLLWGVPPASETLHLAVRSGGGIVDKVYWQWNFM